MRSVSSSVYTKEYYLKNCLGYEEFDMYKGEKLHPEVEKLLHYVTFKKGMKVLDLGCGRGDTAFYLAKKGNKVTGIDYAKDAIKIAKRTRLEKKENIKRYTQFFVMDAKNLQFPDNSFDIVLSFDVFEHLYPEELELAVQEIKRVLKSDGILLIHTEANKLYLNFTHNIYVYPMSTLLVLLNKLITGNNYPGLPKDPRSDIHKQQHVNEPTYFSLKHLFFSHQFSGKIISSVSMVKTVLSWKDLLYNVLVLWYPLSVVWPFHLLFAYDYICIMKNKKK